MWTVSLPVTVVNGSNRNPSIEVVDIVGWILWAIGLSIEAVADQQKLNLKKNSASKGRWCDVGVWYWSRHPNYFGEVNITILVLSYFNWYPCPCNSGACESCTNSLQLQN